MGVDFLLRANQLHSPESKPKAVALIWKRKIIVPVDVLFLGKAHEPRNYFTRGRDAAATDWPTRRIFSSGRVTRHFL